MVPTCSQDSVNSLTTEEVLVVGLDVVCELQEDRLLREVIRHAELRAEEHVRHIVLHPHGLTKEVVIRIYIYVCVYGCAYIYIFLNNTHVYIIIYIWIIYG